MSTCNSILHAILFWWSHHHRFFSCQAKHKASIVVLQLDRSCATFWAPLQEKWDDDSSFSAFGVFPVSFSHLVSIKKLLSCVYLFQYMCDPPQFHSREVNLFVILFANVPDFDIWDLLWPPYAHNYPSTPKSDVDTNYPYFSRFISYSLVGEFDEEVTPLNVGSQLLTGHHIHSVSWSTG